jgi:hypothetical protein
MNRNLERPFLFFTSLSLATALIHFMWIGLYSRPIADEFCYEYAYHKLGFLEAQRDWYLWWTGRYGFNILETLFSLLGAWTAQALPMFWIGALTLGVSRVFRSFLQVEFGSVLLAGFLVLSVFLLGPNLPEALYWRSGSVNYLTPLVIGLFLWPILLSPSLTTSGAIFLFLGGITVAGFSELHTSIFAFLIGIYAFVLTFQRRYRQITGAALVSLALLLGVFVVILAPGNEQRLKKFPPLLSLDQIILLSTNGTLSYLERVLTFPGLFFFTGCVAFGTYFLKELPGRSRHRIFGPILLGLLVVIVFYLVGYAAIREAPYPRSYIMIDTFVLGLFAMGFCETGRDLKRGECSLLVFLACVFSLTVLGLLRAHSLKESFSTYAIKWDARMELITMAQRRGEREVQVPLFPNPYGLEEIGEVGWVNDCVGKLYNLEVRGVRERIPYYLGPSSTK